MKTGFTILALFFLLGGQALSAGEIRDPVFAGRFYPARRTELEQTLARYMARAKEDRTEISSRLALKALILPHAGYIYSGYTAAHGALALKNRHYAKVIVMGPDHRTGIRGAAISNVTAYATPLGRIKLHPEAKTLRERSPLFTYSPLSDRSEHSLEVVLPFLQASLYGFKIIPVVIGGADPRAIAAELASVMDPATLFVASSDLSHFLPYDQAVTRDRETLAMVTGLEPDRLMACPNCACGKAPIAVVLHLARQRGWRAVLLNYTNSGDTAGDKHRVVGYAAVAFYETYQAKGEKQMAACESKEEGQILLDHARRTIMQKLGQTYDPEASSLLDQKLADTCYGRKSGTFVTLTLNNQLRGCIGNMSSALSLRDGVQQNAVNAAFHDPRFSPLTDAEMKKVHIEISVLTEPVSLAHAGGDDLVDKLRPHIDGVILSRGLNRATFLPQVWKQLPRPEDFLARLCMKAGLSADAWRTEALDVQTYQVISFEEEP